MGLECQGREFLRLFVYDIHVPGVRVSFLFLSFGSESALKDRLLCQHRGRQVSEVQIHTLSWSVTASTELLPLGKCLSGVLLLVVYEDP